MPDCFHYVAGSGLALGSDHRRTFADAPERFPQICGAADEGNGEVPFVDVVSFVGWSEHLGLVDVIDAESLDDLSLDEMPDAALGHYRDRHCFGDLGDLLGVGHTGNSTLGADVCRHTFEGHHGYRSGLLGNEGLCGVGHVHDDPALEHFGQAALHTEATGFPRSFSHDYFSSQRSKEETLPWGAQVPNRA